MATKILINGDRIIFDGHADTRSDCEMITLLCNGLKENPNFKTIEYCSGYAEFEKVGHAEELKFIGTPASITMKFDSNIVKVVGVGIGSGDTNLEWTTSDTTQRGQVDDGTIYTFNVTLAAGFIIDKVTLSDTSSPNGEFGELMSTSDTSFKILAGSGGISQTVTITSKQAPSRISVDLATAFPDKWAALDPGEHTIQIRAKNPGNYLDSDLSTAITFVKVVDYTITANLTNCTGASTNPTTIASNTTGTVLKFTANTGYDLPANVTVSGATSSWNQSTGELTLTKPTGNVTVIVVAAAQTYNITVNATNATAASTNPTTIVYEAGAQLKFTFPDGYFAPTDVTVTGATQIWDAATGALTLSNCTGPVTVTIEGAIKTYTITPKLTNCTWNGTNPATIASNQFTPIELDIVKNTGWTLPTEISVSGVDAEYWTWNQATGTVTISHPQGNVTVTVDAVREVYNINTTLVHALAGTSNPTTIGYGLSATLTFTFPTGYEAPASVDVTGATQNWTSGTGTLVLSNPTGNVTVKVVGVAASTTIDGGTYKWLDSINLGEWTQALNFTSNGTSYTAMQYTGDGTAMTLQYRYGGSEWVTVYNYNEDTSTGSWVNDAYKIVDLGTSAQTVTAIFKSDFIANTTKLTQLATPQNVTADGTNVSWDEVENATSYEVLADGANIGTVQNGYKVTFKFNAGGYTSPEPCRGHVYYSLDNGTTWIDVLESNTGTTFVDIVLDDVKQIKFKCIADGADYGNIDSGTGSLAGINIYTSGHETKISDNYVITEDSIANVRYSD